MTADWHLDRILLSLNQEIREEPERVIRAGESLGIPRQIFYNQLCPRRRQEENPGQSGQGQDGTQAHLDGSREHLGQGLGWDGLPNQRTESAWVSPTQESS